MMDTKIIVYSYKLSRKIPYLAVKCDSPFWGAPTGSDYSDKILLTGVGFPFPFPFSLQSHEKPMDPKIVAPPAPPDSIIREMEEK
jgi:hypothetical protein